MAPSSAGSWQRGADVIDLDRYMRGARVAPARSDDNLACDELVVDGGGVGRAGAAAGAGGRYKQLSHDSGVSDGSYDQRTHRRRRGSYTHERAPRNQGSARTFNAPEYSESLRAFRSVCEQALLDQQRQIARVAQLCERLTRRHARGRQPAPDLPGDRADRAERPAERVLDRLSDRVPERCERAPDRAARQLALQPGNGRSQRAPSDSSDLSSSSRSTKDLWRKEKHRTQECKTYKIIMSKLDELNRRFSPRGAPRGPPGAPRSPPSSSVSVCDKLVSTDPARQAVQIHFQAPARAARARPRVVAQAYNVDIAPRHAGRSPNVTTESVVQGGSSCGSGAGGLGDPCCNFDLEDPVHLYSQAKRLQALTASTKRARSHSSADPRDGARAETPRPGAAGAAGAAGAPGGSAGKEGPRRGRSPSLCALCRGYWRSLRQCLVASFSQDCKCS